MTHIVVVDDHPIIREGMSRLLLDGGVASEVTTFDSAEAFIASLHQGDHFDLCLLDLAMPGMGGLEAISDLTRAFSELPIIILTAQPATSMTLRAVKAGARGFLSKGQDPTEIFDAISRVRNGGYAIDPDLLDALTAASFDPQIERPHEGLSNREYEIMVRLAGGESLQKIGADLCISPKTVSTYRRRTLEKMGFDRNAQLTEYVLTQLNDDLR